MIVYKYGPFDCDDGKLNQSDFLSRIGNFMMRYNLSVAEAIENMLASGQVPNMFLKAVGFDDFLHNILSDINSQIDDILKEYDPKKNIEELEKLSRKLAKKSKVDANNIDELYQKLFKLKEEKKKIKPITELIKSLELKSDLESANRRFDFTGNKKIPEDQVYEILKKLVELEKFKQSLEGAIIDDDYFNFDQRKLRQVLGEEKYQEFLEIQEQLVNNIQEVLENNGYIEQGGDEDEMQVSGKAIEYLSSRSLKEIYGVLQPESSGNMVATKEGEGEQITAKTRAFEFGDSVSNIDWVSTFLNAKIKQQEYPKLQDVEVFTSRGKTKNSIVVLLDMSGSMFRANRFYYAKKMTMALDRLIKTSYPLDKLEVVGFGSLAKRYSLRDLFSLQPFPVIYTSPVVRLRVPIDKMGTEYSDSPLYFTNLQRGLSLARRLLGSNESKNKQIILITDGVPTAHIEGESVVLNYPPTKENFDKALKEAAICRENGIIINTFLLTSDWWDSLGAESGKTPFIQSFAKVTEGRIFQSHPNELGVMVLHDFVANTKKKIGYEEE